MSKLSPFCRAWLSAVGISFSAAIALAEVTVPEPAAMAEAERVIVTGSYIPTAEELGPNPVLTINRELIEKSGERTTEELLRNLTVANANGLPVSSHVFVGAATISGPYFDFAARFRYQRNPRADRRPSRRSLWNGSRQQWHTVIRRP